MTVRIADAIARIDPERWDAVAGGEIAMSHRWQRAMEAAHRPFRPRYVLIEDERGPLASAVASLSGSFGRAGWREALLRRLTLAVGATFSSRHCGVALRPGASPAAALPRLEAVLADLGRRQTRPLIGVANVAERDLPAWRARGYRPTSRHDHMVLDVDGRSYDQCVERLPTEDLRELRRVRRKGAAFGAELAVEPLAGQGDRLYPLLAETFGAHGTAASAMPLSPGLFAALERELPGEAVVLTGRVGGQLAGFFLGIRQGRELLLPLAGLRYELARPSHLYFLMLDHLVRWSADEGLTRIYGGTSNERQKARHGFEPRAHWFCVRASVSLVDRALALALDRAGRPARAPTAAGLAG